MLNYFWWFNSGLSCLWQVPFENRFLSISHPFSNLWSENTAELSIKYQIDWSLFSNIVLLLAPNFIRNSTFTNMKDGGSCRVGCRKKRNFLMKNIIVWFCQRIHLQMGMLGSRSGKSILRGKSIQMDFNIQMASRNSLTRMLLWPQFVVENGKDVVLN